MQGRNNCTWRIHAIYRMRILLHVHQDGGQAESDEWLKQLRAHLPEANIQLWCDVASPECDYAVVWKAPKELLVALSELGNIKAIFNLGAGVDAVLAQGGDSLAALVPIVRIDDGGMAEQMSDYVTAAILSYYRNFHTYAAQQRSASWKPQLAIQKSAFPVGILGCGTLSRSLDYQLCCSHYCRSSFINQFSLLQACRLHLAQSRVYSKLLEAHPGQRTFGLLRSGWVA